MSVSRQPFPAKCWRFSWSECPANWEGPLRSHFGKVPTKGWIATRAQCEKTQRPCLQGYVSFAKKVRKTSLKHCSGIDFTVAAGGLKENVRQLAVKGFVAQGCCSSAASTNSQKPRISEQCQSAQVELSASTPASTQTEPPKLHWALAPLQSLWQNLCGRAPESVPNSI